LPPGLDSDKNYCCISSSYYIIITFFFLREAFCALEYAEYAFAAGASPGPHSGSSRRPKPFSRLGMGHPSPDSTPLGAGTPLQRSGLPLHIISGYAIVINTVIAKVTHRSRTSLNFGRYSIIGQKTKREISDIP